ncbi:MAG TPA: hypothetical protein LFV66_01995 [Rickettsia endosymbiont of Bembidion lapponicum]|nr:hypothetical protein [Rickettsia endosymbiont of Bembidion lapponicum]
MSINILTILSRDLSGSLSDYSKNTTLSFQEAREQAWKENAAQSFTKSLYRTTIKTHSMSFPRKRESKKKA